MPCHAEMIMIRVDLAPWKPRVELSTVMIRPSSLGAARLLRAFRVARGVKFDVVGLGRSHWKVCSAASAASAAPARRRISSGMPRSSPPRPSFMAGSDRRWRTPRPGRRPRRPASIEWNCVMSTRASVPRMPLGGPRSSLSTGWTWASASGMRGRRAKCRGRSARTRRREGLAEHEHARSTRKERRSCIPSCMRCEALIKDGTPHPGVRNGVTRAGFTTQG